MKRCRAFPLKESGKKADVIKSVCRFKVDFLSPAFLEVYAQTVERSKEKNSDLFGDIIH